MITLCISNIFPFTFSMKWWFQIFGNLKYTFFLNFYFTQPISGQDYTHIETSQLICNAFTGLYMCYCTKKCSFPLRIFFYRSKCDQIRRKMRILSHLLKKSLTENFIFCVVCVTLAWYELFEKSHRCIPLQVFYMIPVLNSFE